MKINWLAFCTEHGWVHCACFMSLVGSAYHKPEEAQRGLAPWKREQHVLWVGVLASTCEARA